MIGHTSSPRSFAAWMSAISPSRYSSISATTCSTVRPDSAIRARIAALISTIAAGMSSGSVSQCGRPVSGLIGVALVVAVRGIVILQELIVRTPY